jgi:hypothetical protein
MDDILTGIDALAALERRRLNEPTAGWDDDELEANADVEATAQLRDLVDERARELPRQYAERLAQEEFERLAWDAKRRQFVERTLMTPAEIAEFERRRRIAADHQSALAAEALESILRGRG